MRVNNCPRRRAIILPLLAVSIIGLLGVVALAVDIGMVAVARTQAQEVADAAAMAAARTLTGGSNQSLTAPVTNAQTVASANSVLGDAVLASDVTVTLGSYHYDTTLQTFYPQYPPVSPDSYDLASATVSHQHKAAFASVFGVAALNVSATAIAAHRPRNMCIVLDYSGSMNNESDLWNAESYVGPFLNTSNNSDPVYPQFGPYNPTFSPLCALCQTSSDPRVGYCNVTQAVQGVPAMVNDYVQSNLGCDQRCGLHPGPVNRHGDHAGRRQLSAQEWYQYAGVDLAGHHGQFERCLRGVCGLHRPVLQRLDAGARLLG